MLKIDMDNNKRYCFEKKDYDTYYVGEKFLVIEKGSQWIGCYNLEHMIGFFCDLGSK